MNATDFVRAYYKFALESEQATGINAIATLAQAALESGWGKYCPGNMFFGVKDTDGVNGNEQLLTTFEYNRNMGLTPKQIGLVSIQSTEPCLINGQKYFKYTGQSYFRKYTTPADSFTDHAKFFQQNSRYHAALNVRHDYNAFIDAIAAAGYAQAPNYAALLKSIAASILKIVNQLNLS